MRSQYELGGRGPRLPVFIRKFSELGHISPNNERRIRSNRAMVIRSPNSDEHLYRENSFLSVEQKIAHIAHALPLSSAHLVMLLQPRLIRPAETDLRINWRAAGAVVPKHQSQLVTSHWRCDVTRQLGCLTLHCRHIDQRTCEQNMYRLHDIRQSVIPARWNADEDLSHQVCYPTLLTFQQRAE